MRNSANQSRISIAELVYFLIGLLLLWGLAGLLAQGQSKRQQPAVQAQAQIQQPLYREYRGIRLGMAAAEVRAKLGEPALKSDEQDFYLISSNETAQIAYNTSQKVVTISTDYAGGVGAPDHKSVVGEDLMERPDGSLFRMVTYKSERFWVSYNKNPATTGTVTITITALK
ncbi:MAG TPA: hypothetical protein VF290_19245 [Pyrinomonadaceae bacterium]